MSDKAFAEEPFPKGLTAQEWMDWCPWALAEIKRLTAERDALKAENEKLHTAILRSLTEIWWLNVADEEKKRGDALKAQLADAAKVSDGVWEWVPKPKYDALLDKIETARKLADEADCMDCSLGLHIRDVLDDVLPLQHVTEQE